MEKDLNRKAVKARKYRVFVLLQWIVVVIISGASVCLSQEQKKSLGELKIEGSHIEKLVLKRKNGPNETINTPDAIIKLPVGEYSLLESHLKGGYVSLGTSTNEWIEVSEEKPAVLRVGAPLEQVLEVNRRGKVLILNYKLIGAGGEQYRDPMRPETRPSFTIYKGERKVGSDKFDYG